MKTFSAKPAEVTHEWFVIDATDKPDSAALRAAERPKHMAYLDSNVAKLVGVSDDHQAIEAATKAAVEKFGQRVTAAASQPYYLDVTHPQANKGDVARSLASRYELDPEEIATIGDQPNDVLMFVKSGVSIAMGQASPEVQKSATYVTTSSEDEGFANAMEKFILQHHAATS